jgi:hypothetical protein
VYGASEDDAEGIFPSPKRRMVDPVPNGQTSDPVNHTSPEMSHVYPSPSVPQWTPVTENNHLVGKEPQHGDLKPTAPPTGLFPDGQRDAPKVRLIVADGDSALVSGTSVSEKDEEAVVYNYTRMLQDPSGRLCK